MLKYATYQQARQAVRRLGIKTLAEYRHKYKKDKKLSLNPHRKFAAKGWKDWYDFLGTLRPNFYSTYKQASQSAQRLRIVSESDYKRRAKNDPRLASHPDEHYKGRGWKGWHDFLGKKKKKK